MKMEYWNIKDLQQPSVNTYKATCRSVDIFNLSVTVYEGIVYFKQQQFLESEAALLSRCIYRMKLKFRKDKGLKAMEKVNRALLQYLRMDLPNTLTNFRSLIPERYETHTYLPNGSLLEYILIRLQGMSKLMVRTVESCQIAALFMEDKISIGHFWKVAFIAFSLVSRISTLATQMMKFVCELYAKLLPFLGKLKNSGVQYPNYKFPDDIRKWLDVEPLFEEPNTVPIVKTKVPTFDYDFEEYEETDEDVKIVEEYIQNSQIEKKLSKENQLGNIQDMNDDLGVVIERMCEDKIIKKKKKNPIENITTIHELKIFINKEDKLRNSNSSKIFKSLDKLQWSMLMKIVKSFILKAKSSSKSEKCLSKAKEAMLLSLSL